MDSEERVNVHLKNGCKLLQGRYRKDNSQVVNATNIRSTLTIQNDHLQAVARHAKKKKDRTSESLKWQSHGVKIN